MAPPGAAAIGLPRLVSFTAVEDAVLVHHMDAGGPCVLQFGDYPTTPGIAFTAVVDVPAGWPGTLEFVQDVITLRSITPGQTHPRECLDSQGQRRLDTTDPYDSLHVRPGRRTITTNDSPAQGLRERTECDDKFRMFLMWRPDRFKGTVRAPIAKLEWWWKGRADSAAMPGDCNTGARAWVRISGTHGATPGVATTDLPFTLLNVTALQWARC